MDATVDVAVNVEEWWEMISRAVHTDSAVFARVFRSDVTPGVHQYWMARRVDDTTMRFEGDFWPRDHGKSEIFCIAYPLRMICENPNVRILIVQKTATEAEKTLQVIKTELERNNALKAFYALHWKMAVGHSDISNATGMLLRDGAREGMWQKRRIYCKRTRHGKDPTVEAVGVGGAITGGHFDIIILDDIEDDENTKTLERLVALREWFTGTIMQLREPHTKTIVVGTLKTAGPDIYNFVLNNLLWNCHVESALISHELSEICYETITNSAGNVVDVRMVTQGVETLWPERWPIEALLVDMLASIRSIWIREKLNDLKALAGAIFQREWFRYVDALPSRFERVIQTWDTAFEESKSADYSVCVTAGLLNGSVYVINVLRAKLEMPALVDAIKREYGRERPELIRVERKASGRSAVQVVKSETTLPILDVDPGTQDKVSRARAVTPYFAGGRVVFPTRAPWLEVLEDELVMFPASAHDDQVDALVYAICELMLSGGAGMESENPVGFGGYGG
ncbi:MAG: phage terminase large subunit [Anaerolineae bacterium]|nr:phage terminase large subunit [Anaerolineae bacterium]